MLVGEPVAVDDLLAQAAQQGWGEERLQVAIADRVGQVRGWLGRRVGRVKGQAGGKQVASFRCGLPAWRHPLVLHVSGLSPSSFSHPSF